LDRFVQLVPNAMQNCEVQVFKLYLLFFSQ